MSDSSFGREQYVIYCSQLRATPSADCNISHIALGLSNYLMHNFHIMKTLLEWYRRSHLRFPFLRSFVFAFSWESPSPTHIPQQIYHDVCSDLSICFHDSCLDLVCHLTHKKVKALSLAWQHLWLEIAIVSFLEIKGLTKQSLVFFFYIAQWRRCRRRKRNRWLHQAQRSSKGNKRTVFIPSICLHYNGCLLRTLLHLSFSGFHAKGYWKAVLSARWESSFFVRRDSDNVCILWRLNWWAKHIRFTYTYMYLFSCFQN